LAASLLAGTAMASESGPVFVVPGRADVPVVYFGRDISGAVVEGDWGLDRPGNTDLTIIYPYPRPLPAYSGPPPLSYFPSMGTQPGYGRREAPMDRRPRGGARYRRSYEAESDMIPATAPSTYDHAPINLDMQFSPNAAQGNSAQQQPGQNGVNQQQQPQNGFYPGAGRRMRRY
jgi:hypothetical protein